MKHCGVLLQQRLWHREQRNVGSLFFPPTGSEDKSRLLLLLYAGTGASDGGGRKSPTLSGGPEMTQHHVPTPGFFPSDHTEPNYRSLLWEGRGPASKGNFTTVSLSRAPVELAATSHQTVSFSSYSSIKQQNTFSFLSLHPHWWTSILPRR